MSKSIPQAIVATAVACLGLFLQGTCGSMQADEPVVSSVTKVGSGSPDAASPQVQSVVSVPPADESPLSVAAARERSRVLHKMYASTLDVLHDHYFHANKAVLPARAMEDIFTEQDSQTGTKARWIAVNARAMSVDHEPADEFEKEAARRLAAGDKEVEQIEKGVYRYAGAIPLHQNCIQCHMGTFMNPPRKPRFAGLVFRTPVRDELAVQNQQIPTTRTPQEASESPDEVADKNQKLPSRTEARERAEVLHQLIEPMFLAVHDNYYREDESLLLPATTFRQVFDEFATHRGIRIRWLAVSAEPMNTDHRPQDEFEHAAVAALKSGLSTHDEVTGGQYRYVGTIRLASECLKCHVPGRTNTRDRMAGIVIDMPVAGPGQ